MRLLFGVVLGAALTIGAAYVHDTRYAPSYPALPGMTRTLVNWDVAAELADYATRRLRLEFERLIAR
jgi:hypothetical protein